MRVGLRIGSHLRRAWRASCRTRSAGRRLFVGRGVGACRITVTGDTAVELEVCGVTALCGTRTYVVHVHI